MDYDAKLQEYGIFIGGLVDGDSRFVLNLVALSTKLAIVSLLYLWLPAVLTWGLPDQLVTDKGTEWDVIVFQTWLAFNRAGRVAGAAGQPLGPGEHRRPHAYQFSTYNTRIERFWFEVNVRVLIPFRFLINHLERPSIPHFDLVRSII